MEKTVSKTISYVENEATNKREKNTRLKLLNFYLGQIGKVLGAKQLSTYK